MEVTQVIPNEAVKAAARIAYGIHSFKYATVDIAWDDLEERLRKPWLRDAQLALEAAAPHMVAEFKRQAAEAMDSADEYIYPNAKQRRGTK